METGWSKSTNSLALRSALFVLLIHCKGLDQLGWSHVHFSAAPVSYSHNSPDKYMPRVTKDCQALHTSEAKLENHLETASNHQLCLLGRGEPKDHIFLSSQSGGFQEGTSVENCARRLNMAELSSFLSTASQCGIFVFLRLLRKTVAQENAMGLSGDSRDSPQMPRHHEPKDRGSAPAPSSHKGNG